MELNIGSNIIRNTSGILSVQGKEQVSLEIGERDGQLLLNMDIYDSKGNHIAKLHRNAWVFNDKDRFEITTSLESLKLTDKNSGNIVVEANVVSEEKIQILRGRFYTHRGHLLEITPQFWRIANSVKMSGNWIDSCGGAVAIE